MSSSVIFSVVSHRQLDLIKDFFADFRRQAFANVRIVLTLNIPEDESVLQEFVDLPISVIRNDAPKGFGANHNFAFRSSNGDVFVIINPDVRLRNFCLDTLLTPFADEKVGACAPVVLASNGSVEDSARRYPTVVSLARRAFFGRPGADYAFSADPVEVDWTAGMFIAFRPAAFAAVGGFDERFFMYYEDADICRRLAKQGWATVLQPATSVIHDAQRASRHNRQHLKWHLESIFRFLFLPSK